MLRMEEFVSFMALRSRDADKRDAPIKPLREEYVSRMVQKWR
jgi:hypothetical protein